MVRNALLEEASKKRAEKQRALARESVEGRGRGQRKLCKGLRRFWERTGQYWELEG